jgi:hypothetical protein
MRSHLPARDNVVMDWAPALYMIRVDGHLGAMTLSAFPVMTPQRKGTHTVLTGWLDQSALYGVLAEMEALGLVLLEVRQIEPRGKAPDSGDTRLPGESPKSSDDLTAPGGDPWLGRELADTHGRQGRARESRENE